MAGEYPYGVIEHMRKWIAQHAENRDLVHASLDASTTQWAADARERSLPLITSECWSTVVFEDGLHAGALEEWDPI
jgi:hypothetical protein